MILMHYLASSVTSTYFWRFFLRGFAKEIDKTVFPIAFLHSIPTINQQKNKKKLGQAKGRQKAHFLHEVASSLVA